MKINEMLNFEPKVNVLMLLFLFLNAVAFDSLYWITEDFVDSGEVIIVKWIVYAVAFVGSLIAFKLEFKRLNRKEYRSGCEGDGQTIYCDQCYLKRSSRQCNTFMKSAGLKFMK